MLGTERVVMVVETVGVVGATQVVEIVVVGQDFGTQGLA
jgi:hypothetical protein